MIPVPIFLFSPYPDMTALSVPGFLEELVLSFSESFQRSDSHTPQYFSSVFASQVLSQSTWFDSRGRTRGWGF